MSPTPSTYQTLGMPIGRDGLIPGLNSDGQIPDIAYKVNVQAKVAAYTLLARESGGIFTNRGATAAVTFTLPTAATGLNYTFFAIADFDILVLATGIVVAFNNVAADSVTFTTTSQLIGGGFKVVCDGTSWLAMGLLGSDAQVITVA